MESKNKELSSGIKEILDLQIQRRDGYEKAILECKGHFPELRLMFSELADESRQFIGMLQTKLVNLDADNVSGAEGKISQTWNQTQWAFTGINKDGILDTAGETEDIISKAYEHVLDDDIEMSAETRQMLIAQHETVMADAARIKLIKNQDKMVSS